MKIIVDTNVIFSAILSADGKIGQLIFYGQQQFDFYAPNLVKAEVKRHQAKLIELGQLSLEDFEYLRDEVFSCLKFISEEQIPFLYWHNAIPLVRATDMDDIAFVVLSEYLDAKLWTSDKKLLKGLKKMGFQRAVVTDELFNLLSNNL
jgi:predicted nucleic acid-binding protein